MKLEEWLYILLRDMGFDDTQEILVQVQGTDIMVDKLIPTPDRPESTDEQTPLQLGIRSRSLPHSPGRGSTGPPRYSFRT